MKTVHFVHALVSIIDDDDAVHRASKKDLAIIEGVLAGVLEIVSAELRRRDQQEEQASHTQ